MTRFFYVVSGACLAAAILLGGPILEAQLQQSGGPGSTVTANQGGAPWSQNLTQVNSTAIDVNSGNKSAGTIRMVLATDQPNLTTPLNVAIGGALAAGTNIIGKTAPVTACGTTSYSQPIAAVPTSSTAITTTTTCIIAAYFNNTNSTAQTITLTDNAGTPVNIVGPAFSVPGLSNMTIPLFGIQASSGIKWSAGGTGVTGGVVGLQ